MHGPGVFSQSEHMKSFEESVVCEDGGGGNELHRLLFVSVPIMTV